MPQEETFTMTYRRMVTHRLPSSFQMRMRREMRKATLPGVILEDLRFSEANRITIIFKYEDAERPVDGAHQAFIDVFRRMGCKQTQVTVAVPFTIVGPTHEGTDGVQ